MSGTMTMITFRNEIENFIGFLSLMRIARKYHPFLLLNSAQTTAVAMEAFSDSA
jgi:hypothetical protein